MVHIIPLDVSSVITDAFSALTSAMTFITGNAVFSVLIGALVAGTLVGVVFSIFRR